MPADPSLVWMVVGIGGFVAALFGLALAAVATILSEMNRSRELRVREAELRERSRPA